MKKILVIGSTNIDLIATMDRFPKVGETIEGFSFQQEMGGKGANQALAAHRAGGNVAFISILGDDQYGNNALKFYEREGIDVSLSQKCEELPTGTAMIWVDQNGDNSIVIIPGANKMLTPSYIIGVRKAIEEADIIVLQMEIPYETVSTVCGVASQLGKQIILNVAPAYPVEDVILRNIHTLIVNQSEAETITGEKIDEIGKDAMVDILLMKGIRNVILTLSSKGCLYKNSDETITVPAFKVKAKDTTAAGDTFCGALVAALSKDKSIKEALLFATAASALCVTRLGAQPSIPSKIEIENFINTRS